MNRASTPPLAGWFLTLTLTLALACAPSSVSDAGVDAGSCQACTRWSAAHVLGNLADAQLIELSGLVASRTQPEVLFAHNDSGDAARFFALSTTGAALGHFVLTGATAVDWEDIALGPCPAGTCVFLGDIGSGPGGRTEFAVYRVPEPRVVGVGTSTPVTFERFPFHFPRHGARDAEALLVHPTTGRIYVITKEFSGPSQVFRYPEPLDPNTSVELEPVATLSVPATGDQPLTAADVNPCGNAVLLRLYNRLVELRLADGADFEQLFAAAPQPIAVGPDLQGESVAYGADSRSIFTSSEALATPVPLHGSTCR